ncbi:MAG: protein kinase [Acidobacteria bacterium]|nr:protein kinase [Acidobacteriota bacterium]
MTPERWQQIERLCHEALELDSEQRQAYLNQVCAADETLRREVESMLVAHDRAGDFLNQNALELEAETLAMEKTRSLPVQEFSHYRILSRIGAGGMGEVWLARDTALDRNVALKLLPTQYTTDKDRLQRFIREAKAASALNHPNIITIYEIGEIATPEGKTRFIAAEYVEGQMLRQRISDGLLGLTEALNIAIQTASALDAAHQAGIVHRDIKPENIMVRPDGLVKVLDFGLAKLSQPSQAEVDSAAPTIGLVKTEAGMVMGTVSYMSPEQARGLEVDSRSDIFSFGILLHEMVSGERPFAGPTATDVIASILRSDPPPLPEDLPEELQRIVAKALQKEPAARYQSAKEIEQDLKELKRLSESGGLPPISSTRVSQNRQSISTAATAILPAGLSVTPDSPWLKHRILLALLLSVMIAILGVSASLVYSRYFKGQNEEIDSLAVMPLVNVGGNSEMEYLSDGLTENLINSLSQLPKLRVMSRNAVFRYKNQEIEVEKIAGSLKVRAILTGRVEQRGDDFTISLELVDARDNRHIWGNRYSGKLTGLPMLESTITQECSNKLRADLSSAKQQQLARRETESSEAHQLYLKGRFNFNKYTQDGYNKSIELFQQAIYKDPNYAQAYAALARAYYSLSSNYRPPPEVMPLALLNARKALELDDTLAESHATMAAIQFWYYWNWAEAKQECDRALALNSSDTTAHRHRGFLLQIMQKPAEAIESFNHVLELDPLSLSAHIDLARVYLYAGQYDQAIAAYRKTLELEPNLAMTYVCIAEIYGLQGKYEQALAELARAEALDKDSTVAQALRPQLYAKMGRTVEARQLVAKLLTNPNYLRSDVMAGIYAALGQNDEAFAWLDKAFEQRSLFVAFLGIDPTFNRLHGDPRYGDLLRRLNLPPAK